MFRMLIAWLVAWILIIVGSAPAHANDDYLVPITVGSRTFTLTISVGATGVGVRVSDPSVTLGAVTKVLRSDATAVTPAPTTPAPATPAPATSTVAAPAMPTPALSDLDAAKAQAVTIPYEELFRYNEQHVGKTVRYVGEVLQVQEKECLIFCGEDDKGYVLRVAVTKGSYGLWDDPIWVDYNGTQRFLEDDIVTVWGVVTGLQKYTAVLGNQITIPSVNAIDIQLGEVSSPRAPGVAVASSNANLRGGPGTGYPIVGGVKAGDALDVTARNQAGDWLQLASGAWIAAFLVDNAPASADLPVANDVPPLPTPAAPASGATNAATPAQNGQAAAASSSIVSIGEEIEAGGWRFKVSEVHKRKAVYFYDESYVAMGHYLVVIIDATNLQSGTDYFYRNIEPWVTDQAGKVFSTSGAASSYAQWQYGGLSSLFTDVNPGNFVRIAFAVDLPDDAGDLLLSTDVGKRIKLGNFAAMASEDV
ncbi:MAG TPA: SH3 domain-containing protein [Chloroflexi bacterium]|nr:SH3 domain-containing protein [Chloroflexota bacterium]